MEFFETKVIKVKKEKKEEKECKHFILRCTECGQSIVKSKIQEEKGNWVNSENLDKIKFPCLCSYEPVENVRVIGMINKGYIPYENVGYKYILTDIHKQYDDANMETCLYSDLGKLIKDYDVHIRKGKILIFEEGK